MKHKPKRIIDSPAKACCWDPAKCLPQWDVRLSPPSATLVRKCPTLCWWSSDYMTTAVSESLHGSPQDEQPATRNSVTGIKFYKSSYCWNCDGMSAAGYGICRTSGLCTGRDTEHSNFFNRHKIECWHTVWVSCRWIAIVATVKPEYVYDLSHVAFHFKLWSTEC